MAVYVDEARIAYGRMKMSHMVADSVAELLDMADKIGVNRKWFQLLSHPHFDICLAKRARAIEHGAIRVTRQQIVHVIKGHRAKLLSDPEELALARRAAGVARSARSITRMKSRSGGI